MLSWMFALVLFFTLGLVLGALAGWWYARNTSDESPAEGARPTAEETIPSQGLWVRWDDRAEHHIQVAFQGRVYKRSWDLPKDARYEFQRYLHRLIRWFDHPQGHTETEAARPTRGPNRTPQLSTAAVVGMYEEIDQVLQNLLVQRGITRRVSLRYAADVMQLFIHVDAERYEHVDDIPDPEIRALIREAARLWEQRR